MDTVHCPITFSSQHGYFQEFFQSALFSTCGLEYVIDIHGKDNDMYQRSQMKKIMKLVLQLGHEGRHCMDRIGKRTGCKETQDRRYSQQIHE